MAYESAHPFPLAHMVFFKLTDRSLPEATKFMDYCIRYLSGHPGQLHFSVGLRDVEISRDVSNTDFDVAMHIVFSSRDAYEGYAASPEHDEFIVETAGRSSARQVCDSYLRYLSGEPGNFEANK